MGDIIYTRFQVNLKEVKHPNAVNQILKTPKKSVVDKVAKTCNNRMKFLKYNPTGTASNQSQNSLCL